MTFAREEVLVREVAQYSSEELVLPRLFTGPIDAVLTLVNVKYLNKVFMFVRGV